MNSDEFLELRGEILAMETVLVGMLSALVELIAAANQAKVGAVGADLMAKMEAAKQESLGLAENDGNTAGAFGFENRMDSIMTGLRLGLGGPPRSG